MANQHNRNHAPVPTDAGVPATQPAPASPQLDANGFDPADFEWRPVPRRARADGWTPDVQQRFIEALARFGVVERACQEVNMSVSSAYALRNAPGAHGFTKAWAAVLTRAADRLLDVAFEQAIEGEEIPIFDQDGVRTGARRRYNTRMAMFLLRAYHPDRFRHANKDVRAPDEAPPPKAVPLAQAVAWLTPVTPAQPHLTLSPALLSSVAIGAMGEAKRLLATPPDDREPYRLLLNPKVHPKVHNRALRRRARRDHQEAREDVWQQQHGYPCPDDDAT